MCTAREGTGVCAARVRLLSNGTIFRETKCLDMRLNPLHCSGGYNTDTDVWVCCSDTDYCNEDLTPTLNLPSATSDTPPSSSSVVFTSSSASSEVLFTPTSSISPPQTMSAVVTPSVMISCPTPLPSPSGEQNW